MSYARVQNDRIVKHPFRVPDVLDRRHDLRGATFERLADFGIHEVVTVPKPADTATTTFDVSVELVSSEPVVVSQVWTERPKTQSELDGEARQANESTLQDRARAALAQNRDFLALDPPSNGQLRLQVDRLSRQMNGLIRLVVSEFDGTD